MNTQEFSISSSVMVKFQSELLLKENLYAKKLWDYTKAFAMDNANYVLPDFYFMKSLENNLENKTVRGASDPTPVYSCYWPKDTLNYYVSVSIPTNDRNLILFGIQAWNNKVIYQSLANGRYGQLVLNETSSSIGADIVVYKNNYGSVGWIGLTRLTNTLGQNNDNYPDYDNIPEGPFCNY